MARSVNGGVVHPSVQALARLAVRGGSLHPPKTTGSGLAPGPSTDRLVPGGRLAATKTAKVRPSRRATPSKANGGGPNRHRTALRRERLRHRAGRARGDPRRARGGTRRRLLAAPLAPAPRPPGRDRRRLQRARDDERRAWRRSSARMRRVIGREGRMDQRASLGSAGGGWESSVESLNALIDDLVRPDHRGGARARRRRRRRPRPQDGPHDRGPAGEGRVPADRHDREHDGRPALVVRGRGHARGARGGHRGQARRPGRGEGRVGHLARPDRVGERHGVEPHRPGAQHLAGGAGGGPRRPDARRSPSRPRARSPSWPTR